MAFRQRTTTFRPQLSVRRVYETVQPLSEIKENPQAFLLHIYIPGYPRDSVKITYEGPSRMVRVTGERLIQGNRWSRFDQSYPIPENGDGEALQGKFETGILILTMPKKVTSESSAPQQPQVETTAQSVADQTKPEEKGQETTPPQPTIPKKEEPIEYQKTTSLPSPVQGPVQEKVTQEDKPQSYVTSEPIKDHSPQKGQGEVVERLSSKITGEPQIREKKFEQKPTLETKKQTDEKAQKGTEEVEPKSTPSMATKTDEKPQKGKQEVEPISTPTKETKTDIDENPPKGQDEIERKPTKDKIQEDIEGAKTTLATGTEKSEGKSGEDVAKERISKKEVKEEDFENPYESRKPLKDKEKVSFKEKENKKEKMPNKETEPSAPEVDKKKDNEGKSKENAMNTEGNKGIRQLVMTRMAEWKCNKEEKLVANIGATVLVIAAALGAYVSYRFAS